MKLNHTRRGRNARLASSLPRQAANRLACAACAIADQFRTIATEGAARYIITGDASLISGADDDGTASAANALRSGSDLPA